MDQKERQVVVGALAPDEPAELPEKRLPGPVEGQIAKPGEERLDSLCTQLVAGRVARLGEPVRVDDEQVTRIHLDASFREARVEKHPQGQGRGREDLEAPRPQEIGGVVPRVEVADRPAMRRQLQVEEGRVAVLQSIPVEDGEMTLGERQNIFFVELDGGRKRRAIIKILGE